MIDKWNLLRSRIAAGMEYIEKHDRTTGTETHERYRGMVSAMQSVLDWMRMSDEGEANAERERVRTEQSD